jgi:hypothetical protein
MVTDTAELIDATIVQLQTLQNLLAEDFHLCRRSGMSSNAVKCGAALEAISVLLPRLEVARSTQDPDTAGYVLGGCRHCD